MSACGDCSSRGLLLRELAANLERAVARAAGSRARDLLALSDEELAAALTSGPDRARRALGESRSPAARQRLAADLTACGGDSICMHEDAWPAAFGLLGDSAPRALFLRGDPELLRGSGADRLVTIVGSRRASAYGREVAADLGAALASSGLVVVSGMASGIDAAAHRGALAGGGDALAVLGAGPERPYPRSAGQLYRDLCESGLVISELPPRTATFRWTFPARNRIMAALGAITVVVESAERSGSLITAEMAADCGRPVGAVPGPVTSWRSDGANRLLADGALVVRGAGDVLDAVFGVGAATVRPVCRGPRPDVIGSEVLGWVERGCRSGDELTVATGLPAADVAAALLRLELDGYLAREGGSYRRTTLEPPRDTRPGSPNTIGR